METEWNFELLEKKDFSLQEIENNIDNFVKKWKGINFEEAEPKEIKSALDEFEKILREHGTSGNKGYLIYLKIYQNQNDPEIKKEFNKIEEFSNRMSNKLEFFKLNLSKISREKQKEFLESDLLSDYKHFLEKVFKRGEYYLTDLEENILTLKSPVAYENWVKMLSGFLSEEDGEIIIDNKKSKKNFSEILELMSHKNKNTRDSAAQEFNKILEKHAKLAEIEINSVLQDKKINNDLRGFERADKSRHLEDDIETEMVDELIYAVKKRAEISKKYYELKAKLLGVKKLGYHERNVPYGKIELGKNYEQAVKFILDIFKEIDKEFYDIALRILEEGRIDAFPKKSKASGAYCFHSLVSQPTYVLLNHQENLRSLTTLAHELGHAVNNELMKKQNALNFGSPKSTAEVASTFFEDFVLERIIQDSDEETKLAILMQKLNQDVASINRQISCYTFEQELHKEFRKQGYLSKEQIGEIFSKHMQDYMGDFVEHPEESKNWWIYWSHIRTYFYVYSYASGLLISKALQNKFKQDKNFILKIKEILSAGTSKSPREIFEKVGLRLDSGLWNDGLEKMEKTLKQAEELAKRLGKIKN